MSYKVEIIERKNPIVQLEASKSSIADLLRDLLNKTKGFKYQITVKALLKNRRSMERLNLLQSCFNSETKTVINHRFR